MNRWPPRPSLSRSFFKAHGLGNDYLVFEEGDGWTATPENIGRVCDRFRGVGADGIVVLSAPGGTPPHAAVSGGEIEVWLRMFNPDGGEFERSGNGLRVLGSYLARSDPGLRGIVAHVGGDDVAMTVHGREGPRHDISVDMGHASTGPAAIDGDAGAFERRDPGSWILAGPEEERLVVVPVSVGNPHLVVLVAEADDFSEARLAQLGPFLTQHPSLQFGANVQLARTGKGRACQALIWERGVGRTSASGTSSCAVAVAMVASGRMSPGEVSVEMPGGVLSVFVTDELHVILRGPVEEAIEGALSEALLATFERAP